jgi:2-polyprenyl-3-methyl-5-hydroxy-6-metoxy-1,4-benzoquinol methylase
MENFAMDADKNPVFNMHIELFSEISQSVSLLGRKVLDFGCGGGEGTVALSTMGVDIMGIDSDQAGYNTIPHAVKYASEKGQKIDFRLMDGEKMEFNDRSFDVVLMIDVLEHISDPYKVFDETGRILKSGGHAVVVWSPYYSPFGGHLRFYSKNPWRQLMPFFNRERFLKRACELNPENTYEQEMAVQRSLNKLTLRKFKKMIARLPFDVEVLKKRPFKINSLVTGMGAEILMRRIFNKLPMIPIIEEFTTQSVLIVLRKH